VLHIYIYIYMTLVA